MAEKNFINVASGAPISVQMQINKTKAKENSESIWQRILWIFRKIWYFFDVVTRGILLQCIRNHFKTHISFNKDQLPKRARDVAVLTGATKGIGEEVLKRLLTADMHVLLGCRNVLAGDDIVMQLRASGIDTGKAECLHLDLSSLDSVQEFAKKILLRKIAVNVLINNAGLIFSPFLLTMDGFESHFQVNYLGHFLLTMLLLPRLSSSALSNKFGRIVNVSSCAMICGHLDFTDLQMKNHYSAHKAYANSKLMQVLSSNYLDMRLQAQDVKVHAFSVDPGMVESDLHQHVCVCKMWDIKYLCRLFMKSPEQAADGIVYAALSPEIENQGGLFLSNCQSLKQPPRAFDPALQQKLWQTSLELCSIDGLQISNSIKKEAVAVTMVEIG